MKRTLTLAVVLAALLAPTAMATPDLVPVGPTGAAEGVNRIRVFDRFFTPDWDLCSFEEGSISSYGWHRLIGFTTTIANVGTTDLRIGNPAAHPELFTIAPCHQHYHTPLARYDLIDSVGNVVATGHKQGFCLIDDHVWDPTIARRRGRYNDCERNQGISRGWADMYVDGIPGQWIEVGTRDPNTGEWTWLLPDGMYTLRVTINELGVLPDADLTNNVLTSPVSIQNW